MKKIRKFHLYTEDIIEVNARNIGKTTLQYDMFGQRYNAPLMQRNFIIYGAKLTDRKRPDQSPEHIQSRYYATLFGIFKFRGHHICVKCGKVVKRGTVGIGIHTDYECLISYWGYTDHMCLSCFVDVVGNKEICECADYGCSFGTEWANHHKARKRMTYDLLQEDYGFTIKTRGKDQK